MLLAEVPAKNHGGHTHTGIRATSSALDQRAGGGGHRLVVSCRRVGLKERYHIRAQFEAPGERAGVNHRRHHSSSLKAHCEEAKVATIHQAIAIVDKWAKLPRARLRNRRNTSAADRSADGIRILSVGRVRRAHQNCCERQQDKSGNKRAIKNSAQSTSLSFRQQTRGNRTPASILAEKAAFSRRPR